MLASPSPFAVHPAPAPSRESARESARESTPRPPLTLVPGPSGAFAPSAAVKLGLVVNPRARALRQAGESAFRDLQLAAGSASARPTESLGALEATVREFADSNVNVLAIAGGDGTLHHTLHAWSRLHGGAAFPGTVVLLRGGTLNIVARGIGASAEDPSAVLARFVERFVRPGSAARLGDLPATEVPLLGVRGGGVEARRGFIFGSEMVKNALEMYDTLGGGYAGLSRFMFEVARGFAFRGKLWQQERWRLDPPPHGVIVDETSLPRYAAAVACTVDLGIEGGFRAVHRSASARGFHAKIITETQTGPLLRLIPALMREGKTESVVDTEEAESLSLHGAYTLDGECFGTSTKLGQGTPLPLFVSQDGSVRFAAS